MDLQLDRSLDPSAIFSTAGTGGEGGLQSCEQEQAMEDLSPPESASFRLMRFGSLVNLDSQASVNHLLIARKVMTYPNYDR